MRKLGARGLAVMATLWAVALTGCGPSVPVEDPAAPGSVEQGLKYCTSDDQCSTDGSYVCGYDSACRKACEPGAVPSGCASGQQCCLGWAGGSSGNLFIQPHCAPTCNYP